MPHIVLQLSGNKDVDLMHKAIEVIQDLTADILKKERSVMATTVTFIDDDQWFIGGKPLSQSGGSAFHLDISITDETNTKSEKSRFVRELYQALANFRGDLHEASYIHLIDARAAAYGYGGRTQEWRHQQAEM
ncbi:4-oxalocrotonate tautomerase [Acerihabitans sp. TG2]|uniref:tautomerase family protein n=1 Tax=Acerihabitans sp. TG2 TaxID=3096008 RepID=UPI002B225232|nr:4-oxalocrotonate tautomerase [Acerihabitans sp. TG2]MEA9390286.1 4-oxalocrotonate tautomerase [Acerihabitans sp. TG2]